MVKDSWKLKNMKTIYYQHIVDYIPVTEQEITMTAGRKEDEFDIHCSDQTWITKLRHNPLFKVNEIHLSPSLKDIGYNPNVRIVVVRGTLPTRAISLRSKFPTSSNLSTNKEILKGG